MVGPGIKKSSSPWRSEIFERSGGLEAIRISFPPDARLSLVHAEDVGRMLVRLAEAQQARHTIYNTPAEIWEAERLKDLIEKATGVRVELDGAGVHGGPICDGARFAEEFGFQIRGLRERLLIREASN